MADSSTATIADNALTASNGGDTLANGTASNTVSLPVTDAKGNPLPDYEVTFTVTDAGGNQTTVTATTDENGIATLPVTSDKAGTVTVETSVGGKDVSVGIDFVADSSTATIADNALTAGNGGDTVANGTASNTVSLPVIDAKGNPLPDYEVTFTVTDAGGNQTTVTATTDENGIATLPITSDKAGTVTVETSVGGKDVSVGIDFVADSSTATIADNALTASNGGDTLANGTASNTVSLPVTDAKGNPLPDYEVTFTVTDAGGNQTTVTATTDENGIATLPITSDKAGTVTVETNVGGKEASVSLGFVADSSTATIADNALSATNGGDTLANGTASNTVSLPVTDAKGNPLPDYEVTFTVTDAGGNQTTVTATTDENGIATLPVTSDKAGTVTVETSVGGKNVSVGLDFVADSSTATIADNALTASNGGDTVADGTASNTVSLPVTDANGNPLPDYEVTFTVTDAGGNQTTVTATTDENGIATLPVTSDKAGTVNVEVEIGGKTNTLDLGFIADSSTATIADNTLTAGNGGDTLANGTASNIVSLPVTDAKGNPLPDYEVTFTVTDAGGNQTTVTATTDENGIATLPITSDKAGTVTVETSVGGKDVSVGIDFVADSSTATIADNALTAGNGGDTLANGTASNTVSLPVTDANGNPLPDYEVTFTVTDPDGNKTTVTATTDENGIATLPVTSDKAGTVTVETSVGGKDVSVGIDFVADSSTATIADNALTASNGGDTVANANASNTVSLPVTDAKGNPLPDYEVTFTVTDAGGNQTTVTATTDKNGVATLPVTSDKAGTVNVAVEVGGKTNTLDLGFIADSSTATIADNTLTAGNGGDTVANGTASNTVSLPVTDAKGNPLPDYEVTFTVTDAGGNQTTVTATTDENGIATLPITSDKAGTVNVETSVGGKDVSVGIDFVADSSTATLADNALTASNGGDTLANGTASNTVSLPVTDAKGNPLPDYAVTFTVTDAGGNQTTVTATTDENGIATLPITSDKAGTVTVETSVGGKDVSVGIDFVADSSTATIADNTLTAGNGGDTLANGTASNTVSLPVTDANGNPLPDYEVTFTVTDAGGNQTTVTATTDENGIATLPVTSDKAGTVTVETSIGGKDVSVGIDFVADSSTATIADNTLTAGNGGDTVANGTTSNTVSLPVTDAKGNPLPDYEVTFTVTDAGGNQTTVTATTDENGIATLPITSDKAGTVTVETSVGGKDVSVGIDFVADSSTATIADNALSATNGGDTLANGTASNTVSLPVTDVKGNPLPDYEVTFTVTDAGGNQTTVTATTDENGIATLPITSDKAGTVTVETSVGGKDVSVGIDFVADSSTATIADNALTASNGGDTLANGTASNTVSLPVTDAKGNPLPDYEVTFTVTDAGGNQTTVTATTDENGIATLPVTSDKAGTVNVAVEVGGKTNTLDLGFIADSSTATIADNALTAGNGGDTLANGTTSNTVSLPVTDAKGNPLPDYEVTFTVTDAGGNQTTVTATTDENGIATLPITSDKAGTVTVETSVGGKDVSVGIDFVADSSTATIADNALTAGNGGDTLANGTASNTVSLPVTDAKGNPLPDYEVTFTVTDAGGNQTTVTATTDENGIATLPITSDKAGTVTVETSVGGKDVSVGIDFVADSSTATIADNALTAGNGGDTVANGTASNTVSLPVTDAKGNPLPDYEVTFTVTDAGGNQTTVTATTDENGIATLPVTSDKAGTVTVETSVGGKEASVEIDFVADSSTAIIVANGLTSLTNNQVANGVTKNKVQAKVLDAKGNPVSGVEVTFTTPETTLAGTVNNQKVTTGIDGMALLEFANTKAGSFRITATVTSPTAGTTSDYEDVTFKADSSTAIIVANGLTSLTNNQAADGAAKNKVQAKVLDAKGNPVSGVEVTFTTPETTLAGTVNNQKVTTGIDGMALLEFANTKAGTFKVTATVTSPTAGTTSDYENVTFKADISTAQVSNNASHVLHTVTDGQIANATANNQVALTIVDANGNPLPGIDVKFTATDQSPPGASVSATFKTDDFGNVSYSLNSAIATIYSIKAEVTSTKTGTTSQTVNSTFIADQATASFLTNSFKVSVNDAVSDNSDTNQITFTVVDAKNNKVKNAPVTITATNGATVTIDNDGKTDDNGVVIAKIHNKTWGTTQVTAKLGNGTQQSINTNFVNIGNTTVNGATFAVTSDMKTAASFPKNGFAGGKFKLLVNADGATNNTYTWSSSNPSLVSVNPTTGEVTLASEITSATNSVVIKASRAGRKDIVYNLKLARWLTRDTSVLRTNVQAAAWCTANGGTQPPLTSIWSSNTPTRGGQSLWAEWGNLSAFGWDVSKAYAINYGTVVAWYNADAGTAFQYTGSDTATSSYTYFTLCSKTL
ncbi:Ig-like domain-containing protein [Serratia aquatilis]|uniref:Ig-like domain-containing protein n=1 Tax=Serratia aquatilis TaxID=1737515 RepID=A0ABV6ED86_9GAMM